MVRKAVIWGLGKLGGVYKVVPGIDVVAYVDKSINARKCFMTDKDVLSPEEFFYRYSSQDVYVIVCAGASNVQKIRNILIKHGFRWGIDAFSWDEFENRHHGYLSMDTKEFLWVPTITFSCTSRCTLRCKDCSFKVPYVTKENQKDKSLQELKNETELFFSKIDYSEEYALVGGEPLLWPYLCEYLDWLYKNYSSQYGWARIVSNSTQKLSIDVLASLARNNVMFEITVYDNVVPRERRDVNKLLCKEYNVKYREINHPYWIDFGLLPDTLQNDRDNNLFFAECESLCRAVEDNRLVYCLPGYYAAERAHIDGTNGSLSLEESKKDLFDFYYGSSMKEHPAYCNYCRGFGEAPHIPVAEQV